MTRATVEERVVLVASQALARKQFVTPVDVLLGLGWLAPSHIQEWRQGRIPTLEGVAQVDLSKISLAMHTLRMWADQNGLRPSETAYIARTRDRRPLQFSVSNDPAIEGAYRTHWVSPALTEAKRARLAERQSRPPQLVVVWTSKEWTCASCGGTGPMLFMEENAPRCLACANLAHLEYLPAGDAGLTRRATQRSTMSAVVVRWSRARKRYERQGTLVERQALAREEPHGGRERVSRGDRSARVSPRSIPGNP
ncbi:MAG: hypothetical protein ACYDDF_14640 [Thermoplasmatota archaeon]